jgi:circadian clock protein KaiB
MERDMETNNEDFMADEGRPERWTLRLFVTGASPNSARAVDNLTRICESHIKGRYDLEVIDIYQDQEAAALEQVIALPLLIKKFPTPERRLIGNMSDIPKVLKGLGLTNRA